jgi:orotidine-5'-phosphate decarboxylase
MKPRREIALAVDVLSREELWMWAETFKDLPVVIKLGLRLLPLLKEGDCDRLHDQGFKIFIDAKLHDIPSQVAGAVTTWSRLGADYLTLHLSGAGAMMKEAAAAAQKTGTELLGVSVLTSLNDADLASLGVNGNSSQTVDRWVRLGLQSGIRSFVCSVGESKLIHDMARKDFSALTVRTVCPGIRLPNQKGAADQSRVFTIQEGLANEVDMFVVGRAVFQDSNPRARVEEILAEISA